VSLMLNFCNGEKQREKTLERTAYPYQNARIIYLYLSHLLVKMSFRPSSELFERKWFLGKRFLFKQMNRCYGDKGWKQVVSSYPAA